MQINLFNTSLDTKLTKKWDKTVLFLLSNMSSSVLTEILYSPPSFWISSGPTSFLQQAAQHFQLIQVYISVVFAEESPGRRLPPGRCCWLQTALQSPGCGQWNAPKHAGPQEPGGRSDQHQDDLPGASEDGGTLGVWLHSCRKEEEQWNRREYLNFCW